MTCKTTRQADQDIIALYGRGAEDFGASQAERYVEGLFSCFSLLAANPHMARERTELDPPMRLHPYGSHLIAYKIMDDGILIVRVLHGRQDWLKLFFCSVIDPTLCRATANASPLHFASAKDCIVSASAKMLDFWARTG